MTTTNRSSFSPTPNSVKRFLICCRICKEKSDGAHFGIDSCRACAAFFRRSMSLKKSYTCRRGGDNCDIRRKDIATCRKCRLKKCIEAGMALENIQSQKGAGTTLSHPDLPSPNNSMDVVPDPEQTITKQEDFYSSPVSNIPSQYSSFCDDTSKSYLQFLAERHKQLCIDRRAVEYSLGLVFSAQDRKDAYYDFLPSRNNKCTRIFLAQLPTVNNFIGECFPEVNELAEEEKSRVSRTFSVALWSMDAHFRTLSKFPYHHDCRYLALTETTYVDNDHIADILPESVNEKRRISVANSLKTYHKPCTQFQRQLKDLKLTYEEYMTLVGLCFWNPTQHLSPEAAKIASHCRRKLFYSFQSYHSSLGSDNFAVRLGEIMSLFSFFLKSLTHFGEVMELLNLFDCLGEEKAMLETLREGLIY